MSVAHLNVRSVAVHQTQLFSKSPFGNLNQVEIWHIMKKTEANFYLNLTLKGHKHELPEKCISQIM